MLLNPLAAAFKTATQGTFDDLGPVRPPEVCNMQFASVSVVSVAVVDAPHCVLFSDLEAPLASIMERSQMSPGFLASVAGVQRRDLDPDLAAVPAVRRPRRGRLLERKMLTQAVACLPSPDGGTCLCSYTLRWILQLLAELKETGPLDPLEALVELRPVDQAVARPVLLPLELSHGTGAA